MELTTLFTVGLPDGTEEIREFTIPVADGEIVRGFRMEIAGQPIIVTPFYMHGERLHTICSLFNDEIEEVNW